MHFFGHPHPARAFMRDTRIPRRHPPPRPRLHEGYPDTSPAAPTPPAPSALLPRPRRGGGGSACDIRGAAVPGSSPGSPHAVDRGDIATGGGADGEGELVPPPLSPTLHSPCFSLPALLRGIPIHFSVSPPPARAFGSGYPYASPSAPTPPAPSALLPRPYRGRGQCLRYQVGSRIRGGAGGKPYPVLFRDLPVHWTVEISPRGEGLTGRGNSFPLPCL